MATEDDADDGVGIDLTGEKAAKVDPEPAEDEDTEDDGQEEWTPPSREEYQKLVRDRDELLHAGAKAAVESKERRQELVNLRKQLRTQRQRPAPSSTEGDPAGTDQDAVARAAAEAAEAAERKLKPVAIRAAARAKFLEAGLNTKDAMSRVLRMLDMDDIDLDDDGDAVGLDEQIEDIKADLPKLFEAPEQPKPEPKPTRPRAGRITAADRKNEAPEPPTTGDKIAAMHGLGKYAGRA